MATDSIRTDSTELTESTERVNESLCSRAVADLHALAWIDPFRSGQVLETGWSCRDHSVLIAALLTIHGIEAQLVHGKNIFVQGTTSDGKEPVGIGNLLELGGGHTWLHVPRFGTVDISPRLSERLASPNENWRPLPVNGGLIGTHWSAGQLATHVALTGSGRDYDRAVGVALKSIDTATAVYWPEETATFSPEMLSVEFVDSPLAHRLKAVAGPECYVKFGAHLYALSMGVRRTLAGVSQRKAWRYLNEVDADLIREFRDALDAGLASRG